MNRIEPTLGDIDDFDRPPAPKPTRSAAPSRPPLECPPEAPTVFGFAGRLGPLRYVAWSLLLLLALPWGALLLSGVGVRLVTLAGPVAAPLAAGLLVAAAIGAALFWVALVVRRLHDLDASGWWALLLLLPPLNLALLLALALAPGTRGPNRHGFPNPPASWALRGATALLLLALLGLPVALYWLEPLLLG